MLLIYYLYLNVKHSDWQAELWVNNMSKDADDQKTNADLEARPSGSVTNLSLMLLWFVCHDRCCLCYTITQLYRLGLGAKVSRQSKFVPSDDPVEKKLYSKLTAEKRKAANIAKESATIARDDLDDDEDSEDLDSRTNAFTKRKAKVPLPSSILRNKKQKWHLLMSSILL